MTTRTSDPFALLAETDWLAEALARYRILLTFDEPGQALYKLRLGHEIGIALEMMTDRQQRQYYKAAIRMRVELIKVPTDTVYEPALPDLH